MTFTIDTCKTKMQSSIDVLKKEFSGLRTNRVSTALLDPITVEAYNSKMPLSQVGSISSLDGRSLVVQVWDKSMVKSVEKAIRESGLGLNPCADGQTVRVPMPELSQERRAELAKIAAKYAEQSRVSVRNCRREALDNLKKLEKSSEITEDQEQRFSKDVQQLTDDFIKTIDTLLTQKSSDISHI